MPTTVVDPSLRLLRAVRARIEAVAGIPALVFFGVEADKSGPYLKEAMWRGDSALAELGDPTVLRRGPYVYQVDLVVPAGRGPDEGLTLADAICTAVQGLQYNEGSGSRVRGWTERTVIGSVMQEPPNSVRFPLTMYLRLDF